MALQTPSQTASYDQSGTYVLSLDAMVSSILLDDHQLLSLLGTSDPVSQTKHEWDEDELNPTTVAAGSGGGLSTASTLLYLNSSQASRVTAGTLLKDQLSGKFEVLQVTARSGVTATVTRGYGATSAESHAASATYEIIAHPRPEGMEGPKDESTARTREYNHTEIFSKGVRITGTAEAIKHNGIPSEQLYQVDRRMRELMVELNKTLIMGIRSAARVTDGTYGTMGGLIDFIKHATNGNTNSTAETLTPSVLNAMIKQVWDDGGMPTHIVVGGVQKQKISAFDKEYRRTTLDSRRAGFEVTTFLSDLGIELPVVVDRYVPNDVCMVIDATRISVRPVQSRSFFLEKLAKTGDYHPWQIVGEYTVEVKNAAKAHAIHWNLKQ